MYVRWSGLVWLSEMRQLREESRTYSSQASVFAHRSLTLEHSDAVFPRIGKAKMRKTIARGIRRALSEPGLAIVAVKWIWSGRCGRSIYVEQVFDCGFADRSRRDVGLGFASLGEWSSMNEQHLGVYHGFYMTVSSIGPCGRAKCARIT